MLSRTINNEMKSREMRSHEVCSRTPFTTTRRAPLRSMLLAAAAIPFLAAPLCLSGCAHPQPVYYPPPPAYSASAQRGYHDGFVAAQRDVQRNLPPDVGRHPRFRNPPAPPPLWEDYRHGFRDGYQRFLHPAPPPGQ